MKHYEARHHGASLRGQLKARALLTLLAALALFAAACGPEGDDLGLDEPDDVTNGGRVVYVLQDVSCDMHEPRDTQNRIRALEIATHAAAFDSGVVAMGVVRELASQNVFFENVEFDREGSSNNLRVDNALNARDAALEELRPLIGTAGKQACNSDLLGALSEIEREHRVVVQKIGHDGRKDIVFVTNGLIVDPSRDIVLTRTPIERSDVYNQTLKRIKTTWTTPNLKDFTIWLVGLGRDENITTERGPAVERLWRELLKPTDANVKDPIPSIDGLPELLGNASD